MNKIIKVLITGSVQAGKDTTIKRLKNDLEQSGYYVVNTNESVLIAKSAFKILTKLLK